VILVKGVDLQKEGAINKHGYPRDFNRFVHGQ
jgi:hypothetical protein